MHVRFSQCKGQAVVREEDHHPLGTVSGILIDPDRGTVEGFFVRVSRGILPSQGLFLGVMDILRYASRITVRQEDVLSPVEDFVRLERLLREQRPVLGQQIRTEGGQSFGRCSDVQFETAHFSLEWLFPRRLWMWGTPIAITEVLEVRREAIIIKNPAVPEGVEEAKPVILPPVPEAA